MIPGGMTRREYLEYLDRFLSDLTIASGDGTLIGFDDPFSHRVRALIRNRGSVERMDPGRIAQALDALRDLESAIGRVREILRDAR